MNALPLSLPPEARRLDSVTVSEHVYRVLRDAICRGAFAPYHHLVQNQLAEQLQVSRTPVRDALLRLAQEGLIQAVGVRGYIVSELTPQDVLDVYDVRLALEVSSVDLAFSHITDGDLTNMKVANEGIAATDYASRQQFDLNVEFHTIAVRRCPNGLMRKLLHDVWNHPVNLRIYHFQVEHGIDIDRIVQEHREIVQALEAGDRPRLLELWTAHVSATRAQASAWLNQASPDSVPEPSPPPRARRGGRKRT